MIEDTLQLEAEINRLAAMPRPERWDRASWARGAMYALAWVVALRGARVPPRDAAEYWIPDAGPNPAVTEPTPAAQAAPPRLTMVGFEGVFYEDRPRLLRWMGRKALRQDVQFHLIGDSIILTFPPPLAFRLELTTLPRTVAGMIAKLVTPIPPEGTE